MPLHWAASGGHTDIVKYLLDHRVPSDEKDDVSISSFPLESLKKFKALFINNKYLNPVTSKLLVYALTYQTNINLHTLKGFLVSAKV